MNSKTRKRLTERFLLLGCLLLAVNAATAAEWRLSAADWSRPRSGMTVQQMPPVADAVRAWRAALADGARDARLQLVYPGGEEGGLWAAELRDWLIALAVPPAAIELVPGGLPSDRLELRLRTTGSSQTEGEDEG